MALLGAPKGWVVSGDLAWRFWALPRAGLCQVKLSALYKDGDKEKGVVVRWL